MGLMTQDVSEGLAELLPTAVLEMSVLLGAAVFVATGAWGSGDEEPQPERPRASATTS